MKKYLLLVSMFCGLYAATRESESGRAFEILRHNVNQVEMCISNYGKFGQDESGNNSGCWWPIEVTPEWMQMLQKAIPTGWTMNALHKLISFQAGPMSVIPNVLLLVAGTVVFGVLAARRFRYE